MLPHLQRLEAELEQQQPKLAQQVAEERAAPGGVGGGGTKRVAPEVWRLRRLRPLGGGGWALSRGLTQPVWDIAAAWM